MALLTACGGPSFYRYCDCKIVANQTQSNKPASYFPVSVTYPYDHYGVLYVWNAPPPINENLDADGKLKLKIASFSNPAIKIGSTVFLLEGDILQKGGTPYKKPFTIKDAKYPEVEMHITVGNNN